MHQASRVVARYRRLIAGLAFFQLVHVLALIAMGTLLLPGLSPALNMADRAAYIAVLGSRLLCDGLPARLARTAQFTRSGDTLDVNIEPADRAGLRLHARVERDAQKHLPAAFQRHFASWNEAVAYIVPQDAAVRELPNIGAVCSTQIVIDATLEDAEPARVLGKLTLDDSLAALIGDAEPLSFILRNLRFNVLGEQISALPARALRENVQPRLERG